MRIKQAKTERRKDTRSKRDTIAELERLAQDLRAKLVSNIRPIVIEFSGTPKSGKTSTARSLDMFLRRNDFKVHMIGESGSVSPISDKRNFRFNAWSAATSLCWLLEALDKKTEFVIIDRGVFDALAWIQWHSDSNQLNQEEKTAMEGFYLIPKWRLLVDIVFLMTAKPTVALEREHKNLLTEKHGRIMEPDTLASIKRCFDRAYSDYGKQFRAIKRIDSSDMTSVDCGEVVVRMTLETLNKGIFS